MARPPRIQFEGACYHVYHRGNRRERIYWDHSDYSKFEEYMMEAVNWSGVRIYDWSQLPNHFHFLLETPEGNIAEFMQRLLTRYSKYFNWAHQKVGHVFQGRYGAKVCDKESYFAELVRYVELNPYRLKKGPLAKLGEWKWSSLRYYLGKEEAPEGMRSAMEEVLGRFGSTLEESRKNLAKFLADGLEEGNWEDFYKIKANRFLGSDEFVERMKGVILEPVRQERRSSVRLSGVKELGAKAAACFGVGIEDLAQEGKVRRLSRFRQALVEVGRRQYRLPVVELAAFLRRSEPAISRMMRRQWESGRELSETRQLLEFLESKAQEDQGSNSEGVKC